LSQVYGIVKQHEGHIDVTTKVREGTTFSVYLPILPASQPELPTQENPTLIQGRAETLLIVEDNAPLRKALVDTLESLNYQVREAVNGQEALAILQQSASEIALVVSDWSCGDGGQALFLARGQRGLTFALILLSGHPMIRNFKILAGAGKSSVGCPSAGYGTLLSYVSFACCGEIPDTQTHISLKSGHLETIALIRSRLSKTLGNPSQWHTFRQSAPRQRNRQIEGENMARTQGTPERPLRSHEGYKPQRELTGADLLLPGERYFAQDEHDACAIVAAIRTTGEATHGTSSAPRRVGPDGSTLGDVQARATAAAVLTDIPAPSWAAALAEAGRPAWLARTNASSSAT
jgi:CheY-like chemotaxis protein